MIKSEAILDVISRTAIVISGESSVGSKIGRLTVSLTDLYGWKISPRSIFVQI